MKEGKKRITDHEDRNIPSPCDASLSLYETILQSVHDGIWVTDKNDIIFFVNKGTEDLSGVSGDEIRGRNILNDFDKLTIEEFGPFYRKARESLQKTEYRSRIRTLSGKKSIHEGWLIPLVKDGVFDGMICTINDQSQKDAAEKALKDSEFFYKNIISQSREMHYIYDTDDRITYVSQQCFHILGYTEQELIGRTWTGLLSDNDENLIVREYYRKAIHTGKKQPLHPAELTRKDGSTIWVEIAESPLKNTAGEVTGIVGAIYDITKRRRNQELIRMERDRAQTYFELAGSFFLVLDKKGRIEKINQRGLDILEYQSEELCGQYWFEKCVPPGDYERAKNRIGALAESEPDTWITYDSQIITRSGEVRLIHWRNKALKHGNDRNVSLLCTGSDITERNKAEAELKSSLDTISRINTELVEAREKAEESDRLKSAFLANMSHEIRTPMNTIMGFSDLLQGEDITPADTSKYLTLIRQSSEYLLRIINDILDISKIEAGSLAIEMKMVDIPSHLKELHSIYSMRLKTLEKGEVKLKLELMPGSLYTLTDETRFRQIVGNLLENAIKFTDKGSVVLGFVIKEEMIEFFVSDTGKGISKLFQDQVFQRFSQEENGGKSKIKGTGLGLAICKNLVGLLGGEIWFDSEEGVGTTFRFTLPLKSKEMQPVTAGESKHKFDARKRVLIVEDDDASMKLLSLILEAEGISYVLASSCKEALEKAHSLEIDLVLLDVQLPDNSGLSIIDDLRSIKQDMVIIAQSAFAMETDKEKCLNAGCNDFISKPIQPGILLKILQHYLKQ